MVLLVVALLIQGLEITVQCEASLVNILSDAGVVVLYDRKRWYKPCTFSWQCRSAITIGSVDDKNTVLRDDDIHSEFSIMVLRKTMA